MTPSLSETINTDWSWTGITATEIVNENEFGNVIFIDIKSNYYRICPEELTCDFLAKDRSEFNKIFSNSDFQLDWRMEEYVKLAKEKFGDLDQNRKYCLKIPAGLGGKYELENFATNSFTEMISCSSDLAFQIKDLKDGQKIKLEIKHD